MFVSDFVFSHRDDKVVYAPFRRRLNIEHVWLNGEWPRFAPYDYPICNHRNAENSLLFSLFNSYQLSRIASATVQDRYIQVVLRWLQFFVNSLRRYWMVEFNYSFANASSAIYCLRWWNYFQPDWMSHFVNFDAFAKHHLQPRNMLFPRVESILWRKSDHFALPPCQK